MKSMVPKISNGKSLPIIVMDKKNFHELARFVPRDIIDPEVKEKLDAIVAVAKTATTSDE